MKQGIHPDYHSVVFRDISAGMTFLTRSTATSSKRTSASHPFYTGRAKIIDTSGQVEKFNRRYARNA